MIKALRIRGYKFRLEAFLIFAIGISSRPAFCIQDRILHSADLTGQGKDQYKTERELVKTLVKATGQTQPPIYAPSLLVTTSDPKVAILIAALGGDGEHSYEYSWVFMLGKGEPIQFSKQAPFYI